MGFLLTCLLFHRRQAPSGSRPLGRAPESPADGKRVNRGLTQGSDPGSYPFGNRLPCFELTFVPTSSAGPQRFRVDPCRTKRMT